MNYELLFTKDAKKDLKKIKQYPALFENLKDLLRIIEQNPFKNPPSFEKLQGDFKGAYSRRINIKHRLVYQVYQTEMKIKVISVWTHYE